MVDQTNKPFLSGILSKVIAAFILASTAITLALSITYYSFEGLLTTVDELTIPNDKLHSLNELFHQITELDQQQRADAIRNPEKSNAEFLRESKSLISAIDTLMVMPWKNDRQVIRLQYMEEILHRRDELFLSYLKLKSELFLNKNLSNRLDKLSAIIAKSYNNIDTTVTTTQKKTTTTTYRALSDKADGSSFIKRLFGRKKNSASNTHVEVKEELNIKVDTLAMARQDSAITEVGHIMKRLEKDQRLQNRKMLEGELDLIATNTVLISELLNTLRDVEKEEQATQVANTGKAAVLVNTSIKRIGMIMIIFFLGAALLAFLILTDITKSNSLRKQLVKSKEEAEQLSQIKQRFLANMSHEIRTPLQSIIGFAEQLKQRNTPEQPALEAIHHSSEHLLHIVNEVLDYSRLESGKLVLGRNPFNLLDLLNEVRSVISMQAERKNISFILEADVNTHVNLIGDPFRLRQILYNLLSNAIKFTDQGNVRLTVKTKDVGSYMNCRFQVKDTGIGMHQDDIERVFELFEQVQNSNRHQEGTGLGLAIVKKLVEAQNGKLHVDTELNQGSTFTIELYFEKARIENKIEEPPLLSEPLESFHGKVMIVDDDPMILKLCGIILEKYAIDYLTFNEPEKALLKKPDDSIKIILLDIRMPTMNGIELCRELRKEINPQTKIVALTAHVLPPEKAILLNSGFDKILSKPFRETELLELLGVTFLHEASDNALSDLELTLPILHQMTMGDEELFRAVLTQFIDETREDVTRLEKYFVANNLDASRQIIHLLAGRIGQVGIQDISDKLKALEGRLEGENALTPLTEEFKNLVGELKALVDKLHNLLTTPAVVAK